jgi:hypothetical protein
MSDLHNEKVVKTRKEHQCLTCDSTIPKGIKAHYCSGIYDGEFYNYYMSEFCKHIFEIDENIDTSDGISSGDTQENVEHSLGIWINKVDLSNKKVHFHFISDGVEEESVESFEDFYKRYDKDCYKEIIKGFLD